MKSLPAFREPFQQLRQHLIDALIPPQALATLLADLVRLQAEAEQLATQDRVTNTLNRRGIDWFIGGQTIHSVAKIDMYDMRQANKVYGIAAVDADLRRLSYRLRQRFPQHEGDFVQRSAGSDEFFIYSTTKKIVQVQRLLRQFYRDDQNEGLMPWDYGVGASEHAADASLHMRRAKLRPLIIRHLHPDNHTEIISDMIADDITPTYSEFSNAYALLNKRIAAVAPAALAMTLLQETRQLQMHAEQEITTDALTGALNWIGRKWYVDVERIKAVAVTDMRDMHKGNLRYGPDAIDQDLRRFASVLQRAFPREQGFLILRSEKAGDEFQIVSYTVHIETLTQHLRVLHQSDYGNGLLDWHYGVDRHQADAQRHLYTSLLQPSVHEDGKDQPMLSIETLYRQVYYLVARPDKDGYDRLQHFAGHVAEAVDGHIINDFHCTLQAMHGDVDVDNVCEAIQSYCYRTKPFYIEFWQAARINTAHLAPRIWLMAKRSRELETIYEYVVRLSKRFHFKPYEFPLYEWQPHMKVAVLPPNAPPTDAYPIFGEASGLKFQIHTLALTCQVSASEWRTVAEFPFQI